MDNHTLSTVALALGVVATLVSGAWFATGSTTIGLLTILAFVAAFVACLALLARPLPNESKSSPKSKPRKT